MIDFLKFKKFAKILAILILLINVVYASLSIVQYFTISYEKSSEDVENVNHVSISSDGKSFIAATSQFIYYYESGDQKGELIYEEEDETCCYFREVELSSNGKYIAASYRNKLFIFKTSDGKLLWNHTLDKKNDIKDLEISSDGEYIAVGANDGKVYLFHRSSSTPLWDYDIGDGEVDLAMSSSGDTIAANMDTDEEDDAELFLFSKETSTPLWNYKIDGNWAHIAISEDGKHIAVGSSSSLIYCFHNSSNKPEMKYKISEDSYISSIDISEDGNEIVAGSSVGTVFLIDTSDSELLSSYYTGWSSVTQVTMLENGDYIAVSSFFSIPLIYVSNIYYFEHGSNIPKWVHFHHLEIWEVDCSADGTKMVSGGYSGIYLYYIDSYYIYFNNFVYICSILIMNIIFLIVAIGYRKKKRHYQADEKYKKYNEELKSHINVAKRHRAEGKRIESQKSLKETIKKVKTAKIEVEAGTRSLKEARLKELKRVEAECEKINNEILKKQVKEKILEISEKYPRMQIEEIGEECGIKDQQLILDIIKDMIQNKEIVAKHFSSTNSIIFEREQITEEIDELIKQFEEWEKKGTQQKKI